MHIIKIFAFHLLMTFRGLVLFVSKLFSILFIATFCALIFLQEFNSVSITPKIMTLGLGIIFTLVYWFYDYLIFYLKPQMLEIMLHK